MKLVGIDSGGTSCRVVLCDQTGTVLRKCTVPGHNPNADGFDALEESFRQGLSQALTDFGGLSCPLDAIHVGAAGGEGSNRQILEDMLRRLLTAGYPARHALRSLNSLCTLRGKAGAVTVDLAEVHLDTGKIDLYKWGAAPSWLLLPDGMQRIGAFGPPPGISVTDTRESVDKLRLHKEETLIMVSDGVNAGLFCQSADQLLAESTGSLPARILELGSQEGADDATAAVIRLTPIRISET